MKRIVINNIDLLSKDEEEKLFKALANEHNVSFDLEIGEFERIFKPTSSRTLN